MYQQTQCPRCGGFFPIPKGWQKKYCPPCIIAAEPCDDCRGRKPLEPRCQGAAYILYPYNENNTTICDAALEQRLAQGQPLAVENQTGNGLRLLRETELLGAAENGKGKKAREPAHPPLTGGIG